MSNNNENKCQPDSGQNVSDIERFILNLTNAALGLARQSPATVNIMNVLNRVQANVSSDGDNSQPIQTSNVHRPIPTSKVIRSGNNRSSKNCSPFSSKQTKDQSTLQVNSPMHQPDNDHINIQLPFSGVAQPSLNNTFYQQDVTGEESIDASLTSPGSMTLQSVFFTKWVSQGRAMDLYASKHPYEYPDGEVIFIVENVTTKPLLSWASQENGRMGHKKYYCLGQWICAHFRICKHSIRATGTMVKKEWDGKSYSGEVVSRGLDGEKKTYEIYYVEDGDREILCEQQLLEIMVKK